VGGWDVPWQELCDAVDRVVGDVGQDVSEVAFRVDAVELGCPEQGVDGGGAFSAAVRSGEQIVFPSERYDAQRAFCGVVVDLDGAVIEVSSERSPEGAVQVRGPIMKITYSESRG